MSTVDPAVFHATVYEIARMIPYGMVTSYGEHKDSIESKKSSFSFHLFDPKGHIARLAGSPAHSRLVGQALKFLQADDVPWQRVISSSGAISDRGDDGAGAARQADRLRQEGVEVSESGTPTKFKVNMARYGWCEFDVGAIPDVEGEE